MNKMMKRLILGILVAAFAITAACIPPKVLVQDQFIGKDRVQKVIMQRRTDNNNLFDVYIRVCDINDDNSQSNCQDTLVLESVVPGSVY